MTDSKYGFCGTPLPVVGPTEEQAIWHPINDSRYPPNAGWLEWFGFMARAIPYSLDPNQKAIPNGQLVKVALGPPAPDNIIFSDGGKFYAQPNYNFTNGQRPEPDKPAYIYFYAAGAM